MRRRQQPLQIMPPVYQLLFWQWCKLRDVCGIVPKLAQAVGNDFHPSPEDLVRLFAPLVRPNRAPDGQQADEPRKKIFRYSADGLGFAGTEVPHDLGLRTPSDFQLEIGRPYPTGLFVPVGWVKDTVAAIQLGAVQAVQMDKYLFGVGPRPERKMIRLAGPRDTVLIRMPAEE